MKENLSINLNFKNNWTKQEDSALKLLVRKYGCKNWPFIAKKLTGRMGKQCRERWYNHWDSKINKTNWSWNEEWLLYLLINIFGNKWSLISYYFNNRTHNNIKNHWNSIMKKKLQIFEEKLNIFILNKDLFINQFPEIFELITKNKTNNQLIVSKKGRKNKQEMEKLQLLYPYKNYLKSINNFNENKLNKIALEKTNDKQNNQYKEFPDNLFLNYKYNSPNTIEPKINKVWNYSPFSNYIFSNLKSMNSNYSNNKSNNSKDDNFYNNIKNNSYIDICYKLFN